MATFSDRLQAALILRDMKPMELSRATKISQPLISQYLSGECKPKQTNLHFIARALNVNEAYLMGADVEPTRKGELSGLTPKQHELFMKILSLTPDEYALFESAAHSILRLKDH